jgi:hypothetical protein
MKIDELRKELEKGDMIYRGTCHDCNTSLEINAYVTEKGEMIIEGGAIYKIKYLTGFRYFFKCDKCFANDKVLRNYQDCEIFSRVVGYLRPIQQWNKGKKAEYDMRKEFRNTEGK